MTHPVPDDTMGGAYFLLLSILGLAVTVQAQDCTRPAESNMALKDEYITLTEFQDGLTVVFVCDVGYETAGGSGKITCTNGVWSRLTLKCQRKSCGSAGELENGVIHYDEGVEFGDKATVTCNQGYNLVGDRELFCGDQGWLNRLPVCEVIKCDPPSKILNGIFAPVKDSYDYDEVIKYTCIADNTLNGSQVLSCSDGGKFKPDPPICTYVECPEPDIKYGKWNNGARPPYGYKSSVTYECQKGYSLKGHHTMTCDINSQWSPSLPECIPIQVTTKPTTTTTAITTTTMAPTDSYTPRVTPGSGGADSAHIWYSLLGVVAGCIIGGGIFFFCQQKKRKRISYHDKEATNNGDRELCPINVTTDLKDDVTEEMNSIP